MRVLFSHQVPEHYQKLIPDLLRRSDVTLIKTACPSRNILREQSHQNIAEFLSLFGIIFLRFATYEAVKFLIIEIKDTVYAKSCQLFVADKM